jgi:hypothetical protein
MKTVVFSRKYAPLKIMCDGRRVGEIIRTSGRDRPYSLFVNGVYWDRDGNPTTRGGASGRAFTTLSEAKAAIPVQFLEDAP